MRLSEMARIVTGGTPRSEDAGSWGDAVDFITPADQVDGLRDAAPSRRLSGAAAERLKTRIVPAGSTNLTCIGYSIGKVTMCQGPSVTNQQINSLIALDGITDSKFLYYLIKNWSRLLRSHAAGSVTPIVNKSVLSKFEFTVPALAQQKAIGEVLGALDDKIAANSKHIAATGDVLEAAFTLICGQSVETIPFAELATINKGVSYRSADLEPSSTALVTLKSFDRNGGYSLRGLKAYNGPFRPAQEIRPGELVVALTDLTQAAEVVGRAVRVPRSLRYKKLVASLDLAIIRPQFEVPNEFVLGVMLQGRFRAHCRSRTSGTTVLHLASDAMPTFRAPLVSTEMQEEYAALARPLLKLRDSFEYEMEALGNTRDALLPQLMSGKLLVKDAEKLLEKAGV